MTRSAPAATAAAAAVAVAQATAPAPLEILPPCRHYIGVKLTTKLPELTVKPVLPFCFYSLSNCRQQVNILQLSYIMVCASSDHSYGNPNDQ